MWRHLARDDRPPGSSEARLFAVAIRFGLLVRLATISVCTVLGVVAMPGQSSVVVAAVGGAIVCWLLVRLRGWAATAAWPGDLVAAALAGASQVWLGPPTAASWAVRTAFLCAVAAHFEWPRRASAAWSVALAAVVGLGVGTTISGPLADAAVLTGLLLTQTVLSRVVFVVLRASARAVDVAQERVAEQQRHEAVVNARRIAEREYLATLHDTACTTLLMVSTGAAASDDGWLPSRARRDLEALRHRPDQAGNVDLAELLRDAEFDHRVRVEPAVAGPLPVAAQAASAVLHGVREAVVNVAQHAGTDTATLSAGRAGDGVWVELVDDGRGFDPGAVPVRHRGIADSVQGRIASAGGTATVTATPSAGTTVRWNVRPTETPPPAPAHLAKVVQQRLFDGYRAGLLCVVLIELLVATTTQVLTAGTREMIACGLLAAVAIVLAALTLTRRPIAGLPRWLALAVLVAATVIITPALPPDPADLSSHWYFGLFGWYVLVLLLDLRLPVVGVVLGAHSLWLLGQVAVHGGSTTDIAGLGIVAAGVAGFQFALAAALLLIRQSAREAAQVAADDETVRMEAAVATHTHADHTRRYADLSRETVPLLTSLANGTLDPKAAETRARCAIEAARMRVLFAERDTAADTLVHELRAAIDVAERRGITVELAVRGKPVPIPREARRALIEPVLAGVVAAQSAARITVLRTSSQVRLSSYSDHATPTNGADALSPHIDVSTHIEGGSLWVQTTWPKTSPSR